MRAESGSPIHPDATLTAAYLEGRLGLPETERMESHLASCASCRRGLIDLRAAMALPEEAAPAELVAAAAEGGRPAAGEGGRDAGGRGASRSGAGGSGVGSSGAGRWLPVAAAAALIGASVLASVMALRRGAPPPARGGGRVYRQTPSTELEALSPTAGQSVNATGMVFRWWPATEADRYVVTVTDRNGSPVATLEARPPDDSVAWAVPPSVTPPVSLLWRVRAISRGRTLAETRPIAFEAR